MKHLSIIFFSLFALFACGGGSDSPSPDPVNTIRNTAPTLSGVLSIAAMAQTTSTLVIDADDAENDSLSFSISNQPEWLSVSITNNQVTLTANPGFFDVGQYSLQASISDGSLSSSYTISLSVGDNPSAYNYPTYTDETLPTTWVFESGEQFHFYALGKGLFKDADRKFYPIDWSIDSEDIRIDVQQPSAIDNPLLETILLEVLVSENGQFRVSLDRNSSVQTVDTVIQELNLRDATFGHVNDYNSLALKMDATNRTLKGGIAEFGQSTLEFSATIGTDGALELTNEEIEPRERTVTLFNTVQLRFEEVTISEELTSISIAYLDDDLIVLKASYNSVITGEFADEDPSVYQDIDEILLTNEQYFEAETLIPEDIPALVAGDIMYSRFNIDTSELSLESNFGDLELNSAGKLEIIDSTRALLIADVISPEAQRIEQEVSWSQSGNMLEIVQGDAVYEYESFMTQSDEWVLSGAVVYEELGVQVIGNYGLIIGEPIAFTEADVVGLFDDVSYLALRSYAIRQRLFEENGISDYSYFEFSADSTLDRWQLLDDGSFAVITNSAASFCTITLDFEQCYEEILNNLFVSDDRATLVHRQFTPIAQKDDLTYFQYNYRYIVSGVTVEDDRNYSNSEVRVLRRVPQN